MISPYARRGYIDSTLLDFTSVLKFIEENWDIKPIAARDTEAKSFMSAFDFSMSPREPVFIPFERVVKETENHYALIEDEYMHVMKMVDKSDQDIYVRE